MAEKPTTGVLNAALAALLFASPAGASKAMKAARKAKLDPDAVKLMSVSLGELERGNHDAAVSGLNKAARRQGSASSYFLLGWAHYQRGFKRGSVENADRNDAQAAIEAYALALKADPKLSDLTDPSRLHFSLALCYEAVGDYERALRSYKAALRAAPYKALIPLHAARLRLKMNDGERAFLNVELALDKARKAGREDALLAAARRDPAFAPLLGDPGVRLALGLKADDGLLAAASEMRGEEMRDAVRDVPSRRPGAFTLYRRALATAASGKTAAALRRLEECFAAAEGAELRRLVLLAKTDVELAAVRDLPRFSRAAADASARAALR